MTAEYLSPYVGMQCSDWLSLSMTKHSPLSHLNKCVYTDWAGITGVKMKQPCAQKKLDLVQVFLQCNVRSCGKVLIWPVTCMRMDTASELYFVMRTSCCHLKIIPITNKIFAAITVQSCTTMSMSNITVV